MPMPEDLPQDAQSLPREDCLLPGEPVKSLEQIAAEQGLKPFDVAEARRAANFWPEDDDIDEFLATLREWRRT